MFMDTCKALSLLATLAFACPAGAGNRNDVFAELDRIASDWPGNDVSIHLVDDPPDPGVLIGEAVTLILEAEEPSHFTLVMVDSKGETSIILPDALSEDAGVAGTSGAFPPRGTGQLLQGEPAGLQTVYLVATENPVPGDRLGIPRGRDLVTLGPGSERLSDIRTALSDGQLTGRRRIARYAYRVDAELELGTRAARRELELRIRQVDMLSDDARTGDDRPNDSPAVSEPLTVRDIRFETDSAELTNTGQRQLDIIGSELLEQQASRGNLPIVVLEGHTDDSGTEDYNDALSLRRAESARRYLIDDYGLARDLIEASGSGERVPVVPNTDDAARALNRRVEIRLVRR